MSESPTYDHLIPLPFSIRPLKGIFHLKPSTRIWIPSVTPEILAIGNYLVGCISPSTGFDLPVVTSNQPGLNDEIILTTQGADPKLGVEGYHLTVGPENVLLQAHQPVGLFRGIQTLRQLFPASIESSFPKQGRWEIPAVMIIDEPRYTWRGTMLDVSRHFFNLEDVKSYIDILAFYKLNILHLHLTDDQGWRLMIESWPNLAIHGGSTQVNGGPAGYYTQAEYTELVKYAQSRYITIVPEIDFPGHTTAALASYPELNPNGKAPDLYIGTKVGFSSLSFDREITFVFIQDVIRELAALTPGPYLHMGGDESHTTDPEDYLKFIDRIQDMVLRQGKRMVGWDEISRGELHPSSVVQYWRYDQDFPTLSSGVKVIMSPASKTYLDMKYNPATSLGLDWAGFLDLKTAYDWDPALQLEGINEADILGIEAPLWTETIETREQIEFMAFPRLLGYAEIGWSPRENRSWDSYLPRLTNHIFRLKEMGINFYQSPLILDRTA